MSEIKEQDKKQKLDWDKIPENGYFLIYYSDEVNFQAYSDKEILRAQIECKCSEHTMLEAHFFDARQEYRWIISRRKGVIDKLITDKETTGDSFRIIDGTGKHQNINPFVFEEEVLVVPNFVPVMKKIRVINYLEYDKNDMLFVKGYRLAPGKEDMSNDEE